MKDHSQSAAAAPADSLMLVQALPPLPAAAAELVKMLGDENTPTNRIVTLIEEDVALASRLVGLANSSYYALPNPVTSVQDAVLRVLGLDLVRGVTLSAIFGSVLDYRQCQGFKVERFWRESLLVAGLSRSLCFSSTGTLGDHAATGYLCGLTLRLGLLGLAAVRPDETAAAFAADPDLPLSRRLRDVLGTDHRQVGADLARQWGIPEPVPEVITRAAGTDTDSLTGLLTSVATLAATMATHEIEISGQQVPDSQLEPEDVAEAELRFGGAVATTQGECARLHQQAQNIAATL
ncbi:MAG: HDOD domain-containing protein [Pseudomonadota bacterium]